MPTTLALNINAPSEDRVGQLSKQFVAYTPDLEAADPHFEAGTERYIEQSVTTEGMGRAVRDAHARSYGLVKGEVEILDRLPAEHAQGIYARPGRHGALIRFSMGSPHAGSDASLGASTASCPVCKRCAFDELDQAQG
jgi:hypothetical protein